MAYGKQLHGTLLWSHQPPSYGISIIHGEEGKHS
jgi:hypothetical protein